MKSFLIFISAVLLIYGGVNYYVYRRILHAAAVGSFNSLILRIVIIALMLAYPLGRIFAGNWLGDRLVWIGSFWLGAMFYGLLLALFFDTIRFGDIVFGWIPDIMLNNVLYTRRIILIISTGFVAALLAYGHYQSWNLVTRKVELSLAKSSNLSKEYHIAVFSDTHLGALVGLKRLNRVVDRVNEINADLCLIIGDLVDEPAGRLGWAVEPLSQINARDGVYIVTGNHEFYTGLDEFTNLINQTGINLLRDSSYTIANTINLIGLDDASGSRQFQRTPISIRRLSQKIDARLPTVLMHHTPVRISEAQAQSVDLMICAHTHGGQIWPFGYLTRLVYGVKQGLSQIGEMQLYLTNGAGTWGPPMRIGAVPEIVHFVLKPAQ